MLKKTIGFLAVSFLFAQLLYGGTTGKIAGQVTDAQTGEPLPGVNIQLAGTALGAATDVDGVYVILNVPPGLYTVEFHFLGYQTVRVSDVRVNVDFTTRLNQALKSTTIEGETVEVVGERNPLVRQDLTNTQVAITAETVNNLPIDNLRDVIKLQAGIVEDNSGNLHIRGGRSNEIAFQVNGLSINNPFDNVQGVGLATNAVEEVSVSAGTFSAEYGNALSGVINFVTKDGGPRLDATFRAYTGDNFSSRDDLFFNIEEVDVFNNARAEWTLGGPVPLFGGHVTFFSSGVYQKDNGHLYGQRIYTPEDLLIVESDRFSVDPFGFSFGRNPDNSVAVSAFDLQRRGASGDREIVPMVTREAINLTGKLSWKAHPKLKFTYDIIFDDGERFSSSFFRRFRFTPDGRPKTLSRNISQSMGITHALSKKTFYTLKLGYNFNKAKTYVFEDPLDPRYIPVVESFDPVLGPRFINDIDRLIIPQTDIQVGGMSLNHAQDEATSMLAKLDVVSQVLPNHEVKFGGEVALHELKSSSFQLVIDEATGKFRIPDQGVLASAFDREPVQVALYALDKVELASKFILNAGVRYEYLDTRAPYNPNLAGTVDLPRSEFLAQLRPAEPKHRLAPRVSLSFPITSEGVIRFSYGIFYQNPTFRRIYANPNFETLNFQFTPSFGNANLKPQRSIQYEMGLQQQFTDDLKIDLTIFYKDVNDLIENRRVIAGEVAFTKEFNVITNVSYASVKGFTVALLKRRSPGGIFSATLDYTFQVGEGAFDDPLALAVNSRTGRQNPQQLVPLDFDRTHVLNGTITFSSADNWQVSAIGSVQSGTPYTPSLPSSVQAVDFEINSDRRPWLTNVDLKIQKFFRVGTSRLSLFMQVQNLLDTVQERFIWTDTGRSLTSLQETFNPTRFNQVLNAIDRSPENFFDRRFIENYYQREDFLGPPREIRWGMTLDF